MTGALYTILQAESHPKPARSTLLEMPYQTLTLMDLTRREGIAPPLEGILAIAELDTQRCTCQLQRLAVNIFKVARVMVRHFIDLIAVNNDDRWILSASMRIAHLDATTIEHRRWMRRYCIFQNTRQQIGIELLGS